MLSGAPLKMVASLREAEAGTTLERSLVGPDSMTDGENFLFTKCKAL